MKSLKDLEGYICIDHTQTSGVAPELMVAAGLPPDAGKGLYEGATYTCGHCQRVVFVNSLRTREREVCRGCMHVICDPCAAEKARTLVCRTFAQKVDELLNAAERRKEE